MDRRFLFLSSDNDESEVEYEALYFTEAGETSTCDTDCFVILCAPAHVSSFKSLIDQTKNPLLFLHSSSISDLGLAIGLYCFLNAHAVSDVIDVSSGKRNKTSHTVAESITQQLASVRAQAKQGDFLSLKSAVNSLKNTSRAINSEAGPQLLAALTSYSALLDIELNANESCRWPNSRQVSDLTLRFYDKSEFFEVIDHYKSFSEVYENAKTREAISDRIDFFKAGQSLFKTFSSSPNSAQGRMFLSWNSCYIASTAIALSRQNLINPAILAAVRAMEEQLKYTLIVFNVFAVDRDGGLAARVHGAGALLTAIVDSPKIPRLPGNIVDDARSALALRNQILLAHGNGRASQEQFDLVYSAMRQLVLALENASGPPIWAALLAKARSNLALAAFAEVFESPTDHPLVS